MNRAYDCNKKKIYVSQKNKIKHLFTILLFGCSFESLAKLRCYWVGSAVKIIILQTEYEHQVVQVVMVRLVLMSADIVGLFRFFMTVSVSGSA